MSHGYVQFNAASEITSSSYEYTDGSEYSFQSASITVSGDGGIAGSLTNSQNILVTIDGGQINSSKNFIVITYTTEVGTAGISYFVKYGGSFSDADLGANWHTTAIEGSANSDLLSLYGHLKFDHDGELLDSSFNYLDGDSGVFTSGSLSLNADGELSGSVTNDEGDVTNLIAGKLSASKELAIYAFETSYDSMGGGVLIKGEEVPTSSSSSDLNNDDGGGGGGGGCLMNPNANFGLEWLLLLAVPALMIRRFSKSLKSR